MANFNLTITNEGAAFLANVIANQGSLDFTEVRFSSTNYVGSEATLTEGTFGGTFITAAPSASVVDLTTINVESSFDNSSFTTDKTLYSIGVIAEDGDGNVALVAVCTTSTPDTIPKFVSVASTFTYNINLTVSDTQNITVTASGAGVVFVTDIVDDLTSENTNKPLSAKQGKVLKGNVDYLYNNTGGKNLNSYPYYETSKTENGLTFTDNGDGTITVKAASYPFTVSTTTTFILHSRYNTYANGCVLKNGNYILSGCPQGGSSSTYYIRTAYLDSNYSAQPLGPDDIGNGATITVNGGYYSADSVYAQIMIGLLSGTVLTQALTFKPMIRDASISDDTYVPYAMTNRELTEIAQEKNVTITAGENITVNSNTSVRCKNNVVAGSMRLEIGATLSAGATIATIDVKPKSTVYSVAVENASGNAMPIVIGANGNIQLFGAYVPTNGHHLIIPVSYITT